MTRIQMQDFRTPEQEREFYRLRYPEGYQHHVWPDHSERVAESVSFLTPWVTSRAMVSAADLSCGDGALIDRLPWPVQDRTRGDLVPAPHLDLHGPLPDSLESLTGTTVDLFILSETLEHVPNPDQLLYMISQYAEHLFLSTPEDEAITTGNPEHYWSWGTDDLRAMLAGAGWAPLAHEVFVPLSTRHMHNPYRYQLWLAERAS